MAFNLASITNEKRIRAPRIILLGVEKIGKSTFASQANNPVFIPIKGEEGIDSINVPQFPVCGSSENVLQCLCSLYEEQHNIETVLIDSSSALEPLIWDEICKETNSSNINIAAGGYGAGYKISDNKWRTILDALDHLRSDKNITSIIIGHISIGRFDDPAGESYSTYNFSIHDRTRDILFRWADLILFANTKVITKDGKTHNVGIDLAPGSRFLYTQKRPAHPGGGRGVFGQLPYELPLSWEKLMAEVAKLTKE
jgi:hypothetical protein